MSLTLQEQYDIYTSYELLESITNTNGTRMNFYIKGSKKTIGFEYRAINMKNQHKVLKSGYIRINNLLESDFITEETHKNLSDKASHYSGRGTQKMSKGCIGTFDLKEIELRNLIEQNIELSKREH